MPALNQGRIFLKSDQWHLWDELETDQKRGIPAPPPQLPCDDGTPLIQLPSIGALQIGSVPLVDAIRDRRSRRRYSGLALGLEELSYLVWATQGVQDVTPSGTRRTVPSAGSRHPFETYLAIDRVAGLEAGLYRYQPLDHALCPLPPVPNQARALVEACWDQRFVGQAAVVFVWTVIPYRTEWRYATISHKVIAMDAGHMCQNLYLACEAIGAGTCAIGAYDQSKMDALLGVDGVEEFVIYVAPVGKAR
jgi:SagB-type dehydrogenase family enzyme